MPLIISFDQNMAALDGKSYAFKDGDWMCGCGGCAKPVRAVCRGPKDGLCEPCSRKDDRHGVWKPEKELYAANRLI